MEYSLIMVKPDALKRDLVTEIRNRLFAKGLEIVHEKQIIIDRIKIRRLWPAIYRRRTLNISFNYLNGPYLPVWLVRGDEAGRKVLELKRELRLDYCTDKLHTLIHCPDGQQDFNREYWIFFPEIPLSKLP